MESNCRELVKKTLHIFDFENPKNNDFRAVRELWVRGDIYRRRTNNPLERLMREIRR
jgi:type I site-specific restriction-modification system R (restriction) subunit